MQEYKPMMKEAKEVGALVENKKSLERQVKALQKCAKVNTKSLRQVELKIQKSEEGGRLN
jgi:hypothetical protein